MWTFWGCIHSNTLRHDFAKTCRITAERWCMDNKRSTGRLSLIKYNELKNLNHVLPSEQMFLLTRLHFIVYWLYNLCIKSLQPLFDLLEDWWFNSPLIKDYSHTAWVAKNGFRRTLMHCNIYADSHLELWYLLTEPENDYKLRHSSELRSQIIMVCFLIPNYFYYF